jgi:two-component system LytT family sensor kinase
LLLIPAKVGAGAAQIGIVGALRSQWPHSASISGVMATDSATLDRRAATARRVADVPKIQSPAEPIARGMGLNQPFFDDKNRAFWILQSIGWSGYFFLRSLSGFANSMSWIWLVHTLLLTATGYSLTLLMASLFRRLIKMKPLWTMVLSLIAVMLASSAFSVIETWSFATFLKPTSRPVGVEYFGAILLNFALLAAWTALYYGINYFLLLEDEIRQREKLEGQASTAQLAMLRYQLNPHFLFNTLNSISTLVLLKQTERANAMLARLSSFLRYTLANEPTAQVTLAQEVETLKLYLEIEKMRFEDRLRPHFKIESETIGARLPSLLLQPLIENAIKYAVTPAEHGADIWITAMREGQAVRIEVADNGDGTGSEFAASQSTGVGLANIRDRLSQAYGGAHRFETRQNERGGFSVIIEIPYETGDKA